MAFNIHAARLYVAAKRPFIAAALWTLYPVPVPGMKTMGVDAHWRLFYDPDLEWSAQEVATVLYHEINHLLREHMMRGEGLDPQVWNIAGDAEINDDIRDEQIWKFPTKPDPVLPEKIDCRDGMLAEAYYEHLRKNAPVVAEIVASMGSGGDGQPIPAPGAGNCGSAATGDPGGQGKEWEKNETAAEAAGARKVGEAESKILTRKVAEEIKQQGIGTVPGHWERWAQAILQPKVNWKQELRHQINRAIADVAGAVDYTYRKPSRRQSVFPKVVLPALRQPIVNVAVVIDTSGSMGSAQLEQAVAEVGGILAAIGARDGVNVISVDSQVHLAQRVFSKNQVTPVGGGGTDMGVGIAHALKLRPRPDVIVVLTDGYTPWPQKAPKSRTIVGIVHGDGKGVPHWAKKVMITD